MNATLIAELNKAEQPALNVLEAHLDYNTVNALLVLKYAGDNDEPEWLPVTGPDGEEILAGCQELEQLGLCKVNEGRRHDRFEGKQFSCVLTELGKEVVAKISAA
jgi:hypothetical protein